MREKTNKQMSEALLTASLLSLSGGLQDAYTYLSRGHVFANAQTGNIVLLSQSFFEKRFSDSLHYLIPLLFFASGVFISELIREHLQKNKKFHWRQIVVLIEIALLFAVGFMPQDYNLIANALVSFSCAMQVQAFRKVHGYAFASTMCIGNMRSGMEALCVYTHTKERKTLIKAGHYFLVILLFALGAGIGSLLINILAERTIWVSSILLIVSFLLMFIQTE